MRSWEKFDVVECAVAKTCSLPSCIGLKSHHGKYVVAEANGAMNANRGHFLTWERFTPKYHGEKVTLKSYHGKYAVAEASGDMNANRNWEQAWEKFQVIWSGDKVGFKSHHGKYVVAEADGRLNANRGHMLSR